MAIEQDNVIMATTTTTAAVSRSPSHSNNPANRSSLSSDSTRAVSPCLDELEAPSNPVRFSTLHGSHRPVTLKFEDVTYCIKSSPESPKQTRMVLNGVTGMVRSGELLAMLGPSGSGKTTLLTALAGRLPDELISGSISYNSQPFSSSMKRKVGFVSQDDVLYPHLTVFETLAYTAVLRLPRTLTKEQKLQQTDMVVRELGLTKCRNTIIGGPLLRGISGGERKRVSIGQEMLVNPSLLLLDEPTSGLDSTTALRIVSTLRGLARGGRTIITTIHQPSGRLYSLFDKLVVLLDGCPIYSGSAAGVMDYFSTVGFSPGLDFANPADFLLDLANGIIPDAKQQDDKNELQRRLLDHDGDSYSIKQFLISSYRKSLYPILKEEIHRISKGQDHSVTKPSSSTSSRCRESEWTTTWCEQFKVLLKRGLKERRHESYSALRIFQVMSVSVLSGLLWWHSDTSHLQDQLGLLFFFAIFWSFFPLFNAVFTFPQERAMLIKERSSGMYRLSSYYFARMAGDLPMELVLPTAFITITYWMSGLKSSLVTFLLTLSIILYNVLVSQGLGLALGALLMDVKQATTMASVTLLVFLLVGGYYIQHIPPFIAWLKYVSFSHYCYKLLVGAQYKENEVNECGLGMHYKVYDFPAIRVLGIGNLGYDVAALTIMLLGYRLLAYVALRYCE
ncbi:hypothetical protein V2J09_003565 [Rumex salicifolius]